MPALTKDQVVAAAFELTPEERREVAMRLAAPPGFTDEQIAEYQRRIDNYFEDPSQAIDRDQLFDYLKSLS